MDGTNRAARMASLMSILREVLVKYFTVLVCCNWEKSAENLSCCHPGHFQRIYRQNLFAPITIKRTMLSRMVNHSQSNDPECSICDSCYCHGISSTQPKGLNTRVLYFELSLFIVGRLPAEALRRDLHSNTETTSRPNAGITHGNLQY